MKIKQRHYWSVFNGESVPRKVKKYILGKRMKRTKLNQLLKIVRLGDPIKTMYERRDIFPFEFCPKCGCKEYMGSGNLTSHPEHWERFTCIRCKNLVAYIDNSPFIHALECKENDYDPSF